MNWHTVWFRCAISGILKRSTAFPPVVSLNLSAASIEEFGLQHLVDVARQPSYNRVVRTTQLSNSVRAGYINTPAKTCIKISSSSVQGDYYKKHLAAAVMFSLKFRVDLLVLLAFNLSLMVICLCLSRSIIGEGLNPSPFFIVCFKSRISVAFYLSRFFRLLITV